MKNFGNDIQNNAQKYFNETKLKDAQLFKIYPFRKITFHVFKWEEFKIYENEFSFILPLLGKKTECMLVE